MSDILHYAHVNKIMCQWSFEEEIQFDLAVFDDILQHHARITALCSVMSKQRSKQIADP